MNSYIIITGGRVDLQSLKGIMDRHMGDYSEDHMDDSTVIAVDKGLEVCNKIGIVPDVIVGDFDSASSVVVGVYRKMADKKGSIKFIDLDTHKDFTDTHVALIYAMDNGATDIYSRCDWHTYGPYNGQYRAFKGMCRQKSECLYRG